MSGSEAIEEDYRLALEELVSNDRYQISNLTLIAKEQVEYAEAISRVIVNHISRVSRLALYRMKLTLIGTSVTKAPSVVPA